MREVTTIIGNRRRLFAKLMQDIDTNTLQTIIDVSYWLHMILIGGFLIEIPQTKHSHLIGTIPNVMFQTMKKWEQCFHCKLTIIT